MTHYPDLSPYAYSETSHEMINIGWLSEGYDFVKGVVEPRVVVALATLAVKYVNQMRGVHHCEFCDINRPFVFGGDAGDAKVWLGSAEIRVLGEGETCYVAPDLIIHYISDHDYCPPEEFCQVVVRAAGLDPLEELTMVI